MASQGINYLKELVYVVSRNKVKKIDLLDLASPSPSRINEMYQLLAEGQVESEEELRTILQEKGVKASAYRNIKKVLRERLLNTLFFIDAQEKKYADRQKAYYHLQKDFAAAQLLLAKNARSTAAVELEKILKKAEYFEFTEQAMLAARLLCRLIGTLEFDRKRYEKYHKRLKFYRLQESWEAKAEELYSDLMLRYQNRSFDQMNELASLANQYLKELQPGLEEFSSYHFHFFAGLIDVFQHTVVNDYGAAVPICEELIQFFSAKPFNASTPIQGFLFNQLVGYLQLGDYPQGEQVAQKCLNLASPGEYNWFRSLEYFFLLSIQSEKYQEAYEIYIEAVDHPRFFALPTKMRETWHVYYGYLFFLVEIEEITPHLSTDHFASFRLSSFKNDLLHTLKDKQGINIAIRILEFLFLVERKQYDKAIDLVEALEKYSQRYLEAEGTLRPYLFIELLLLLPRAEFNLPKVSKLSHNPLLKLEATPRAKGNPFHKTEIIPFERLWQMVVGLIEE